MSATGNGTAEPGTPAAGKLALDDPATLARAARIVRTALQRGEARRAAEAAAAPAAESKS